MESNAMKRFTWLLLGLAMVVMVASPIMAAEKAAREKKSKRAPGALRGEYAIMAGQCELSDEQKADIQAKLKAREEALAAWNEANSEKRKAAMEAVKKAKEAGDKDATKKAAEGLKALDAERRKIEADSIAEIMAVLTAEQKAKWEAFRTYRTLMMRYKRVDPTEAQTAKIREVAAAAAKDLGAAAGDDKEARKKQREIQTSLQKTIEETILTAEQREALQKKPDRKPRGEKKAKPKAEK